MTSRRALLLAALCSAAGSLANSRLVKTVPLPRLVRLAMLASVLAAAAMLALAVSGIGGYPAVVAGFGAFFVCFGLIGPNATALALAPHGRSAGSAAAALGFVQTVVPAAIASAVAVFYDGTAVPSLMATLALVALSLLAFGTGREAGAASATAGGPARGG